MTGNLLKWRLQRFMKDVLIIEDNKELGALIRDFLTNDGYDVEWMESAEEGLEYVKKAAFKMLLLDLMLPGMDGYEMLQEVRKEYKLPVLMMSAKTDDASKILGLEVGADDFIDKPFSFPVLSSKIKALIRRSYDMTGSKEIVTYKDISINTKERIVTKGGIPVNITGKEYDILLYFMEHPEEVIKKEKLFNEVWGVDCFSEMSTMNVYIRWLREKLEEDPKNPDYIRTVWKVGYCFGGEK